MFDIDFNVNCWYAPYCSICTEDPDCRKICQMYMHVNYFIMNCGMPNATPYMKKLTIPEIDKQSHETLQHIKDNIVDFVNNGENLYICSKNVQNAKTTWSLKLMYKYFDEVWAGSAYIPIGYFVNVPDLLAKSNSYKDSETDEYKEMINIIRNADIVIWDGISNNVLSEKEQRELKRHINHRLNNQKSNIYNGLIPDDYLFSVGKELRTYLQSSQIITLKGEPYINKY